MRWSAVCAVKVVKAAGRLLEEFTSRLTFVGRATFSRPGEIVLSRQATPLSFFGECR